jgi:hypothetical protein
MNKVSNFIKEVTARLKGDEAGVVAAKVERKAQSAINGQLAALRAKLVDDETAVEDAEEAFNTAVFPTSVFTDNRHYVTQIQSANTRLEEAKDQLEATKEAIAFFEKLVAENFD